MHSLQAFPFMQLLNCVLACEGYEPDDDEKREQLQAEQLPCCGCCREPCQ